MKLGMLRLQTARLRPRLVVLAAGLALALARADAAAPDAAGESAPPGLRHEVAELRLERELSAGQGFYLRLDVGQQRLALMLQGVTLDDYAASGLELGVPEVLFVARAPDSDWDVTPISKGRLSPERQRDRIEVTAPAPAAGAGAGAGATPPPSPPPIPKSAEEVVSVPSPYRIVFAEGVSLEVRSQGGGGARHRSWLRRLVDRASLRAADLGSALGFGSRDRVRLRVTLGADDAAALYRSLPPDVSLIVVGLAPR
jgi:hypothetical protein